MKQFKYSLFVFIGAGLWGIESLFVKPLSHIGLSTMQLAFLDAATAAIVTIIFVLIKDRSAFRIRLSDLGLLAVTALSVEIAFKFFYYTTIIHSQASVAVMLCFTSPIFVMIFSRFLFKEKMTARKYICLFMTVIGCACVAGFIGHAAPISLFAFCTGIATGISYAVYTILMRLMTQRCSVLTVCVYTLIFGMLFWLPFSHPGEIVTALETHRSMIPLALSFGIVCNAIPCGIYAVGVSRVSANKAAILAASEPIVGAIVGMTVFHESHEPLKLFGIVLVLTAIIWQELGSEKGEML